MVVHVVRSLRGHENCGKDIITEAGGYVQGGCGRGRVLPVCVRHNEQAVMSSARVLHPVITEVRGLPDLRRIWLLSATFRLRYDRLEPAATGRESNNRTYLPGEFASHIVSDVGRAVGIAIWVCGQKGRRDEVGVLQIFFWAF